MKLIITCFFVSGYSVLLAQILQPYRYEKDHKSSDEDYTIISLREDGLALVRDKNKYKSGIKSWELILLDTALQEKNTLDLDVDQRKNLTGFEHTTGTLYLLFKAGDNLRSPLDLVAVELESGETIRHEIKTELNFQLSHFIKVDPNFVLGGYVNSEPTVLIYNTQHDNTKVLPGFFQKQTELVDLRPNQNQTFNAILIDRSDRDQRKLLFRTFDASGKELLQVSTPIEDRYLLQTSISSTLIHDDLLVLGTWGSRNASQSNGFYSLIIDPYNDKSIKYTAFGELNSYLEELSPKRAKKIKEKTQSAINQKRIPDFVNYVMPYRMEEREHYFVLLAEAYIPSSTINRYPNTNLYNTPHPYYSPFWGYYPGTYNRLFNPNYSNGPAGRTNDEIKSVQAVIMAYSPKGALVWDYSLKLEDIRSSTLEQTCDYYVDGNKLTILYKKESELKGKTVILDENQSEEIVQKIKLKNDSDEVRFENKAWGYVRSWYGNNFYVWGHQNLSNKQKGGEGNRQVFYINKITIH
ncbi:MAG: hypothetical protein KF687_05125 [Cyclobacteriaceae bacterium]|nr:hypothetical protein [Cyclobacteriaceae bacterium]